MVSMCERRKRVHNREDVGQEKRWKELDNAWQYP